jgi:hypothetical protein
MSDLSRAREDIHNAIAATKDPNAAPMPPAIIALASSLIAVADRLGQRDSTPPPTRPPHMVLCGPDTMRMLIDSPPGPDDPTMYVLASREYLESIATHQPAPPMRPWPSQWKMP